MFNSQLIQTIIGDDPKSIALSNIDNPIFTKEEMVGAKFCKEHIGNKTIYADAYRNLLFVSLGINNNLLYVRNLNNTPLNLFLGEYNLKNNQINIILHKGVMRQRQYFNIGLYTKYGFKINEIYVNQKS